MSEHGRRKQEGREEQARSSKGGVSMGEENTRDKETSKREAGRDSRKG